MDNPQIDSTANKIQKLLSSGAVTVTGPTRQVAAQQQKPNDQDDSAFAMKTRCFVCDDEVGPNQQLLSLADTKTTLTNMPFPSKIAKVVGESFMVLVSKYDVICTRCSNIINYWDRLEKYAARERNTLLTLINKKYGFDKDNDISSPIKHVENKESEDTSPPNKIKKLNIAGTTVEILNIGDTTNARKSADGNLSVATATPATNVNQLKSATPTTVQQQTAGTQTVARKTTRIYKCLKCDYKTTDMRLFNTHYETCMQQNFQCKNCQKIFPNFGAMKQHMMREHNTPMENTCSVCHINFINEPSLRRHMEANHSTSMVVTSTTTLPAAGVASAKTSGVSTGSPTNTTLATPLYTCCHCPFKSSNKTIFDDHFRKHGRPAKPRPFKCRLCYQRFETREAATTHAKQHQANFKCGTCLTAFSNRELLIKHFEQHHSKNSTTKPIAATQSKSSIQTTQPMTIQKLLQDTIDEALSDNVESEHEQKEMSTVTGEGDFRQGVALMSLNNAAKPNQDNNLAKSSNAIVQQARSFVESDDIESIFEKMHAETPENTKTSSQSQSATFNISIPHDAEADSKGASSAVVTIDMPLLDQPDEGSLTEKSAQPVSMPSLDDENEMKVQIATGSKDIDMKEIQKQEKLEEEESGSKGTEDHQVEMELDENMQAQVDGGQIKFIFNESGQLLQMGDHIITDSEGNQILVQDPEQLQQLLQSCGVLQAGEGVDGETLQMMTNANGEMVLVQGDNNETQLIDASLLNAEGQLVIQQGADGELGEGAHVIGEDGMPIPVSVSYTADGQPILQVQQHVVTSVASNETNTVQMQQQVVTSEVAADKVLVSSSETEGDAAQTENITEAEGLNKSDNAVESEDVIQSGGVAQSTDVIQNTDETQKDVAETIDDNLVVKTEQSTDAVHTHSETTATDANETEVATQAQNVSGEEAANTDETQVSVAENIAENKNADESFSLDEVMQKSPDEKVAEEKQ